LIVVTSITGAWNQDEIESFLDSQTIPLRLSYKTGDEATWIVSLWYQYRDGELYCATKSSADVVNDLKQSPRCSFEISTNEPPYKGVRGTVKAHLQDDTNKETLRSLIERYLGDTSSELAGSLLSSDRAETRIRLDIISIYSWDFTDRMKDVTNE
jgi:nitroimidazol reductase NimA-like FMN-containing flavoprotein (pyridoxamine 5'-phosphate oxidase superfamily)